MFGIICISSKFVPLYFGIDFNKTSIILSLLSITIPILGWGNVIRTHYLIPYEMDKVYIKSAFIGAIINLLFNIFFIPTYGAIGACYGTIIAEIVVAFYQTYSVKNEFEIKKYLKENFSFFYKSFLMFVIINLFNLLSVKSYIIILLQILSGIIIYLLLNYKYILSNLDIKKILFKIKRKGV